MTILVLPGLPDPLDDALVLPGVDERAVDRLLLREEVQERLQNVASALLDDAAQERRDPEDLGALRQPHHVVDDRLGVMAAQAGELERLMVDQYENAVVGCEQGAKAAFGFGWSLIPQPPHETYAGRARRWERRSQRRAHRQARSGSSSRCRAGARESRQSIGGPCPYHSTLIGARRPSRPDDIFRMRLWVALTLAIGAVSSASPGHNGTVRRAFDAHHGRELRHPGSFGHRAYSPCRAIASMSCHVRLPWPAAPGRGRGGQGGWCRFPDEHQRAFREVTDRVPPPGQDWGAPSGASQGSLCVATTVALRRPHPDEAFLTVSLW